MSTEKPSHNEDEYFARQDAELLRQQRTDASRAADALERKSHYMKCPKDGANLVSVEQHGVQIEQCPECHGMWLDQGELEELEKHHDPGFMGRVLGDVFRSLRRK